MNDDELAAALVALNLAADKSKTAPPVAAESPVAGSDEPVTREQRLLNLRKRAKELAILKRRKEQLAKLLANWPTVEQLKADPERLQELTRTLGAITQKNAKQTNVIDESPSTD